MGRKPKNPNHPWLIWMSENDKSRYDVVRDTGIPYATLSAMLQGTHKPGYNLVTDIAKYTSKSESEVMSWWYPAAVAECFGVMNEK